jgi:hypothetical protein
LETLSPDIPDDPDLRNDYDDEQNYDYGFGWDIPYEDPDPARSHILQNGSHRFVHHRGTEMQRKGKVRLITIMSRITMKSADRDPARKS